MSHRLKPVKLEKDKDGAVSLVRAECVCGWKRRWEDLWSNEKDASLAATVGFEAHVSELAEKA